MPLKAYKNMNAYKLFVLDVGLLGAMSELPAESILEGNDIFVEFKGALTEQYVLQQLISDTLIRHIIMEMKKQLSSRIF